VSIQFNDAGRERWSWAAELGAGIINAFPNTLKNIELIKEIAISVCQRPDGGYIKIDEENECCFVWGNIRSLVDYLQPLVSDSESDAFWQDTIRRNLVDLAQIGYPRLVIHAESWTTIERKIWEKVHTEAIYLSASPTQAWKILKKADIFIIEANNSKVAGLSVKTGTGKSEVKLSQQSTSLEYAFKPKSFTLEGGMRLAALDIVEELKKSIPADTISVENTELTPTQFNKLNSKDKLFSVIKHKNGADWLKLINKANSESLNNLRNFNEAITSEGKNAQHNLRVLIINRLVGSIGYSGLYELWLSGYKGPMNLSRLMSSENGFQHIKRVWGEFRKAYNSEKLSLVIYTEHDSGKKYVVCKIEPSFDGWRATVSQTKGIIYYFQEGSQLHLPTVWDLLDDLWQEMECKKS